MIGWFITIACSGGPDTMERIERAEHQGYVAAIVATAVLVVAAAVVCWRLRRVKKSALALLVVAVVHPGFTCGARHGDCGSMVEMTAWPTTIVAIVLAVIAIVLAERSARRAAR
jgi:uncharacterized membrane protein YhaH (DUF805 family)